jgi:hypothetical protein
MNKADMQLVADTLSAIMHSDSHITLNMKLLLAAIELDYHYAGEMLTEEECVLFVQGNEDGEVPEILETKYPTINKVLGMSF